MANLLLISLIFFISVSTNYGIELIPICKNDIFNYTDIEVNSVYKLKYNRKFKQILDYTIDMDINYFDYFKDQENVIRMSINRVLWNEKFLNIFSDRFINNPDNFKDIIYLDSSFSQTLTNVKSFLNVCLQSKENDFKENSIQKVENGYSFQKTLEYLYNNKFDQYNETIDEIKNVFQSLDVDEDSQTLAFQSESIDYIYKNHEILMLDKFILNKFSKIFFDRRSSGTLLMDMILPFNDVNYKEDPKNCITAKELPKFYNNN